MHVPIYISLIRRQQHCPSVYSIAWKSLSSSHIWVAGSKTCTAHLTIRRTAGPPVKPEEEISRRSITDAARRKADRYLPDAKRAQTALLKFCHTGNLKVIRRKQKRGPRAVQKGCRL